MNLHFHNQEISVGICLLLGAVHALEPGHGKTAFVAHLLTEKKNIFRPLALALSTAVTHALSILVISIFVHSLIHVAIDDSETGVVFRWLNLVSGLFLVLLGIGILRRTWKPKALYQVSAHRPGLSPAIHSSHCSCALHRTSPQTSSGNTEKPWKTLAIGFAVGLIPCPSALAALSTALTSRDFSNALLIIFMFSLGIFISLTIVGSVVVRFAKTFQNLSLASSGPRLASQIQFTVLTLTGLWHIGLFLS